MDKNKIEGSKEKSHTPNIISRKVDLTENGVVVRIIVDDDNENKEEEIRVMSAKEVSKMSNKTKKKVINQAKNDRNLKSKRKKLDAIVDNINKAEVVTKVVKTKNALIEHINKLEKMSKERKDIPNTTKQNVRTNIPNQDHKKWDEFTAETINLLNDKQKHIVNDLDEYIKRVVALPKDERGEKQVVVLNKYLNKISIKDSSKLTQDDIDKINKIVEHEPIDYEGLVSICKGHEECGNMTCPLYKIGKEPIGERCPIEEAYVEKLIKEYLDQILLNEYDVIGIVEYNLIINLVECDLVDWRLRNQFNIMGYLIDDISVDPKTGTRVINKKHNPLLEIRKQNDNRKATILKSLLATPEIKRRLNVKSGRIGKDTSSSMNVDAKIKSIVSKVKEHRKLIDVSKGNKSKRKKK